MSFTKIAEVYNNPAENWVFLTDSVTGNSQKLDKEYYPGQASRSCIVTLKLVEGLCPSPESRSLRTMKATDDTQRHSLEQYQKLVEIYKISEPQDSFGVMSVDHNAASYDSESECWIVTFEEASVSTRGTHSTP